MTESAVEVVKWAIHEAIDWEFFSPEMAEKAAQAAIDAYLKHVQDTLSHVEVDVRDEGE
jgi:hypothetical protein